MYHSILVAADIATSERTKELLAQAQRLCAPDGVIRLLHVMGTPATPASRASAMACLLALSDGTDSRILPVLREGAVAPQVMAMVQQDKSDLVMLASRLPGLTEFFRDTTATKLTRHSAISVLVARKPASERTIENV